MKQIGIVLTLLGIFLDAQIGSNVLLFINVPSLLFVGFVGLGILLAAHGFQDVMSLFVRPSEFTGQRCGRNGDEGFCRCWLDRISDRCRSTPLCSGRPSPTGSRGSSRPAHSVLWIHHRVRHLFPGVASIICNAGDVVINSRQIIHGSFANTGFEPRLSVNFGFHKRSSVLNVRGAGMHAEAAIMDTDFIDRRSRLIGLAIDARAQRFPDETPYDYEPFAGRADEFVWSPAAQANLKDYNLMDLSI